MERAINKAIDGGYEPLVDTEKMETYSSITNFGLWVYEKDGTGAYLSHYSILLDPLFWSALGKQQGWNFHCEVCGWEKETDDKHWYCEQCERMETFNIGWIHHWHSFIDHIANGGNIDDFFNNLIK